ncbi:peptide synthetase, partial [Aureobasidium melanogenum]
VSVFEIFFTWYTGMCLCSASKDVLFRDLENAINELDITHLSMTPTVAALTNPAHIPRVQFLVTAGEAVTHQVHNAWAGKGLYQGYGPSETTNICTVNPAVEHDHVINNIGPPFENTSAFVLTQESDFQLVPLGGLGELCFGGQQVFRGYQNMPELTDSKIINHPTYGRIYRSGDLGRLLPDGTILIQGRTDDQRKIRGQRIELGEISGCLLQVQNVQDCAIEIVKSADNERLLAFWIPSGHSNDTYSILQPDDPLKEIIATIFAHLVEHLPVYMIPDALVPVSAIPQTLQGKIDRRRLAKDALELGVDVLGACSQGFDDEGDNSELSATEKQVLSALADTLRTPSTSISRSTSFFALGLDSVSAIRFATKLRSRYSYDVDVSRILKRPTVAKLASHLQDSQPEVEEQNTEHAAVDCETAIGSDLHESVVSQLREHGQTAQQVLPCTPLQEAMLSAKDTSGSSAYRNKTLFRLHGSVDKLKACWETMLQRHSILRTTFLTTENSKFPFVQAVLSEWTLPWEERDTVPDHPSALLESTQTHGDPLHEFLPPWKIQIYRADSAVYLLLDMHHALYDANAMSNLLLEVEQSYKDQSLPDPVSFKPFLDFMVSSSVEQADKFFRDQLQGFIPKPFENSATSSPRESFGTIADRLDCSRDAVETFLTKHSTTMLSLIQAMWAKTLSASQCYSDICFGNVVSGRSIPVDGIESLVAPCFNTIPLRADLAKHRSNLTLIKALQKANIESLPYQLTPLRRIQAQAGTNGQRLFDSLVLLQQTSTDLDTDIWALKGETGVMDFPCIVEFMPTSESYTLSLHFNRSYLDDEVVANLHQACLSAFSSCIKYPSSDVSDFIDFDKTLVAGSLKPDEEYMQSVEAALQKRQTNPGPPSDESWSALELRIRAAFSAVSSAPEDQISRDTTIYKLGLDSISAIQLANRLRKEGLPVQASDVMEGPSCSELASAVQTRSHTPTSDTPAYDFDAFDKRHRHVALETHQALSGRVSAIRPCTPLQSGMLSEYTHSDGHQYFNHTFYAVEADIDAQKLGLAWSKVLEQHEILRTGFVDTDDHEHPFVMLTYDKFDVNELEIRASSADKSTFEYRERTASDSVKDNLHLPPWRWSLLETEGKLCLQFSAHHAIFDAESLRLIMTDLESAFSNGSVAARPSIESVLSHILSSSQADLDQQRAFWSQKLSGAPVTRMPNMTPVRASSTEAVNVELVLGLQRDELEARCRDLGVSMQSVGQAAWARLLSAYTGE